MDISLGGITVTHIFIPIRHFSDKLLLSDDFLDDFQGGVSVKNKEVAFETLGVSVPMLCYLAPYTGSLPRASVFFAANRW